MSWLRLNNFEYAGYVNDVDAHLLPPNLVSRLENAHGNDGVLEVYPGYNEYVLTSTVCSSILNSTNFSLNPCADGTWNGDTVEATAFNIVVTDEVTPWPYAFKTLVYTLTFGAITTDAPLSYSSIESGGGWTVITTITPGQTTYVHTATVTTASVNNDLGFAFSWSNYESATWSIDQLYACT